VKILVTGRNGQLAQSIAYCAELYPFADIVFTGQSVLDLENIDLIAPYVERVTPDLIVNVAAWTAVDDAEDAPARAKVLNADAPEALAKIATKLGAQFIHISTDYVYSGDKASAYVESDPVGPKGVYGATKLEGEQRVFATCPTAIVLRTAWVYSAFGKNFVKSMLGLASTRTHLNVVADQYGNPTSAIDLAKSILTIAQIWNTDPSLGRGEIYHCAGTGDTNWAEFAAYVFKVSQDLGGAHAEVAGIPASDWPTKAVRPENSRLECSKLKATFGIEMPSWKTSVSETVTSLLNGANG